MNDPLAGETGLNGADNGAPQADDELAAAPDPIAHAAPDAELAAASMAMAGPELTDPMDEQELEELAVGTPATRAGRRPAGEGRATAGSGARVSQLQRLVTFLRGSWTELQRVQWPDRRQVVQATGVVIGFVIVAGLFLGLSDLASSHLMDWILK